jgi:hypothetical protein
MEERIEGTARGFLAASCLFCAHTNPAGSKYCNECGSPLHLRPCRFCNAINNASAIRCHACDAALPSPQAGVDAAPAQAAAEPVTEASAPEVAPTRGPPRRLVQALIVLLVVVAAPSAYLAYWQAHNRDSPSTAPGPAISGDGTAPLAGSTATDRDRNASPQPPGGDATTGAATPLQAEPAPPGSTSASLDGSEASAAAATTAATEATPSAPKRTATAKSGGKSSAKSSPKSSRSSRAKGTKSGTTPPP